MNTTVQASIGNDCFIDYDAALQERMDQEQWKRSLNAIPLASSVDEKTPMRRNNRLPVNRRRDGKKIDRASTPESVGFSRTRGFTSWGNSPEEDSTFSDVPSMIYDDSRSCKSKPERRQSTPGYLIEGVLTLFINPCLGKTEIQWR